MYFFCVFCCRVCSCVYQLCGLVCVCACCTSCIIFSISSDSLWYSHTSCPEQPTIRAAIRHNMFVFMFVSREGCLGRDVLSLVVFVVLESMCSMDSVRAERCFCFYLVYRPFWPIPPGLRRAFRRSPAIRAPWLGFVGVWLASPTGQLTGLGLAVRYPFACLWPFWGA